MTGMMLDVEKGIARLTLCRAARHNAFDADLIAALSGALEQAAQAPEVRVLQLLAEGPSFSAGADLDWMQRMAGYSQSENLDDARQLGRLMWLLNDFPKPTIALVQGAALGGGVGLVACCDFALAAPEAFFALSEVKLGLIPAVISPYVMAAIGPRAAKSLFLSGARIDAAEAHRLGLVTAIVPREGLRAAADSLAGELMANGPQAMAAAKALVRLVQGQSIDDALIEETARRIAACRASDEGREGIAAFLEKRRPAWRGKD